MGADSPTVSVFALPSRGASTERSERRPTPGYCCGGVLSVIQVRVPSPSEAGSLSATSGFTGTAHAPGSNASQPDPRSETQLANSPGTARYGLGSGHRLFIDGGLYMNAQHSRTAIARRSTVGVITLLLIAGAGVVGSPSANAAAASGIQVLTSAPCARPSVNCPTGKKWKCVPTRIRVGRFWVVRPVCGCVRE